MVDCQHIPPAHLPSEEVAAYLDRTLPHAERLRMEAHLAECELCRSEVVAVSRLLRGEPPRQRRWIAMGVTAAASAAVLVLTVVPRGPRRAPPINDPVSGAVRGTQPEGTPAILAVTPVEGSTVDPGRVAFIWRRDDPGATYQLTLTDESGAVRWSGRTSDTTIALPSDVPLERGRGYFWYVDALRADGRSATTGVRRFTTAP